MIVSSSALRSAFLLAETQFLEATVHPDEEGWHLRVLSPSHVSLVDVRVGLSAFKGYEVWEPFAVAVKDVLDALSTAGEETEVSVKDNRLVLKSNGLRYRKPILVPEDLGRMPATELDTEVMMPSDRLLQVVSKGDPKHGAVRFTVTEDMFTAAVVDEQDLGVVLEVPGEECTLLLGEAVSHYGVQPWLAFLRALPKGTELDIQFSKDFPALVRAEVGGLTVSWFVAPLLMED